jgi:hypothetical protein
MNPRERLLSWIVAGTVFVLLNLWILSWIFGALGGARRELATRRATLAEQALYVERTRSVDETRRMDPATSTYLKNPAEASDLLDQLKEVAGKYDILVENPRSVPGDPVSPDGFCLY